MMDLKQISTGISNIIVDTLKRGQPLDKSRCPLPIVIVHLLPLRIPSGDKGPVPNLYMFLVRSHCEICGER